MARVGLLNKKRSEVLGQATQPSTRQFCTSQRAIQWVAATELFFLAMPDCRLNATAHSKFNFDALKLRLI